MGIRDTINSNPRLGGLVAAAALTVISVSFFVSLGSGPSARPPTLAFYSADDGNTWFVDDIDRIPPFEHEGQPACRAYVFSCGGRAFVGYLQRYTTDEKRRLEASIAATPAESQAQARSGTGQPGLYKTPGGTEWISPLEDQASVVELQTVTCEDGQLAKHVAP